MKKYYLKKTVNPALQTEQNTDESVQEFLPLFDEEGEYKYVPAQYEPIAQQAQFPYGYDFDGYCAQQPYGYAPARFSADARVMGGETARLGDEVRRLKDQIDKMQQKNEFAQEIEKLKKELVRRRSADKSQVSKDAAEVQAPIVQPAPPQRTAAGALPESRVEELIKSSVEKAFEQAAESISRAVVKKLEGVKLTAPLPVREAPNGGIGEAEYHELIGYIDDKIENLKETIINRQEQDFARQQEILHKFTLAAERVQPGSIIDTENLYTDTVLDGITELKQYSDKQDRQSQQIVQSLGELKATLDEQGGEFAYLRTGLSAAIGEEFFKQYEDISRSISKLENDFSAFKTAYEDSSTLLKDDVQKKLDEYFSASAETVATAAKAGIAEGIEQLRPVLDAKAQSDAVSSDKLTTDIAAHVGEIKEQILAAKESVSQSVLAAFDAVSQLKQKAEEARQLISESFEQLTQNSERRAGAIKSEITAYIEEKSASAVSKTEELSRTVDTFSEDAKQRFSALKEEIAAAADGAASRIEQHFSRIEERATDNKSELSGEIFRLKNDIAAVIDKAKGAVNEEIEKVNAAVSELPVRDIVPKLEELDESISGFARYTETAGEEMQRVNINMGTLLKHAEDSAFTQSSILSANEGISMQIEDLENRITDSLTGAPGAVAGEQLSKKLAKDISAIIKDLSADKEADRRVANELAALRNVVLTRLTGPDMPSELSSLYTELKKIRVAIDGITQTSGFSANIAFENARLEEVRAQLSEAGTADSQASVTARRAQTQAKK